MTQADYDALLDTEGNGFFGLIPMEAVAEMLFRVKTFRVVADFTSSTLPAINLDKILAMPTVADEVTLFADRCASLTSEKWENTDVDISFLYLTPFDEQNYGPGFDTQGFEVIHVTDATWPNVFAVNAWFVLDVSLEYFSNRSPVTAPTSGLVAEFVLSCGTFSIPLALYNGTDYTGTLTISAAEWFPYAKPDGNPLFDDTTGILVP